MSVGFPCFLEEVACLQTACSKSLVVFTTLLAESTKHPYMHWMWLMMMWQALLSAARQSSGLNCIS